MMNAVKRIVPGIVALTLCGAAVAHSISGDDWFPLSPGPTEGTGTSVVVSNAMLPGGISLAGITSLSFSPGTVDSGYGIESQLSSCKNAACYAGTRYTFDGSSGVEDVALIASSSTYFSPGDPAPSAAALNNPPNTAVNPQLLQNLSVLSVLFGYTASDCQGETASLTVNNVTYKAMNPCSLKGDPGPTGDGTKPGFLTAGPGDLTFVNGVLQTGTGVGWTESTAVAAPEVDIGSAASGLTLLLGGMLVLRGRTAAPKMYWGVRQRSEIWES